MKLVDGYVICVFVLNRSQIRINQNACIILFIIQSSKYVGFFLYRESESGLINCFIDGVKELLPFDFNNFELRGVAQYGDLVINVIFVEVDWCL